MKTKKVSIGNATIHLGDCFSILPKLDVKIDVVISDPPYAAKSFGKKCSGCDWDRPINLPDFWRLMECITKPQTTIALFCNMRFAYDLIDSNKKGFRYDLVWQKSNKVGFLNANLQPMRNHETILVFGQPGFQRAAVYNPQKCLGGKAGIKTINHCSNVYNDHGEYIHVSDGSMFPSSVLYFKSERGQHPTQKPLALMEWLIQTYTNEGDTILDPFCGSGSTGVAAINTGRKFIGIEKEKRFFDIACDRITKTYEEVDNG